jgi:hypothetical protein
MIVTRGVGKIVGVVRTRTRTRVRARKSMARELGSSESFLVSTLR